jgi:adenylate cyclase
VTDNIQARLALRERELALIFAIDALRDEITDDDAPNVMYLRLLKLLMTQFEADAGVMSVMDSEATRIDSVITLRLSDEQGLAICQPLLEEDSTHTVHRVMVKDWAHSVGIRIVLNGQRPMGVVVLLRQDADTPFTDDDLTVMQAGEEQLDSAVVQAQRIWRLSRRNRELAAIFELDQLRDEKTEEKELVSGFVQIVVEQFQADLCMVILGHPDTGEFVVRGMVDRTGLQPHQYAQITESLQTLHTLDVLPSPREDIHLLGTPFIINNMMLGGMVVGRKTPFDTEDRRLLTAMSSQMDSAIVYSRVIHQLSQRNKELQIIYHIDQIRDQETDFDALLQAVLGELCTAIDAEMGYILLYSEDEEEQLEIKSASDEGIIPSPSYYERIQAMSRRALEDGNMVYDNEQRGEVRSIIAVPLILRDQVIGVFGGVNSKNPRGFNAEDRRMLHAVVSQTDTAVFERMEQRRVRQVLGRSVDPKVLEHLLTHAQAKDILAGERMEVSVLFADLRGSTEWAERTEPDKLARVLNAYLGRMTDVIFDYGGTLDKFVGDEVIGLFGAPLPMADHAERCAAAALQMQVVMNELIHEMESQGYEVPPMGVGVSSGEAICGEFGTSQRTDYTAMGRMMNLGARLCGAASAGEVIISAGTYDALSDRAEVELREGVTAKGIGQVTAYKLTQLDWTL